MIELSVIVPAFNEEERLGRTMLSIISYVRTLPYASEILVVDDGSRDKTADIARRYSSAHPHFKVLRYDNNRGKGFAVRTGMLNALGRYRLFMDADGSTDIRHWSAVRKALNESDIVIGSRHVEGSRIDIHQAPYREALGTLFRRVVRVLFGLTINDTQNGFKAFTADAAERIFRRQTVSGWAFDVEVLSMAKRLGYSMMEVPITWIDDDRSRMTLRAMPRMLVDILKIRLSTLRSRERAQTLETPQWV